ncbi:serine/arginine repetitive matrix protein 2 [Plakobranchus ocellatus]|uniref:Serine/arginine repetitive matrix protein 2 n=1 Tax=Plakobranchus ocellatus TaxID=259542 RepID=A0AAV3ZTX7_9GAST|nr:serine/arginine repetitive matrix protein 2 [Plakobranchus ocellatus]
MAYTYTYLRSTRSGVVDCFAPTSVSLNSGTYRNEQEYKSCMNEGLQVHNSYTYRDTKPKFVFDLLYQQLHSDPRQERLSLEEGSIRSSPGETCHSCCCSCYHRYCCCGNTSSVTIQSKERAAGEEKVCENTARYKLCPFLASVPPDKLEAANRESDLSQSIITLVKVHRVAADQCRESPCENLHILSPLTYHKTLSSKAQHSTSGDFVDNRSSGAADHTTLDLGVPLGLFRVYAARATHQLAEANQEKNDRLKEAFGLNDYVEGSAFDPDRKAKEEAAKAAALAQKKYSIVDSSDEEAKTESTSAPQKKKKKRSRHSSDSPERSKEKRKKSRKHKKDRSHSRKHKKSRRHSKKSTSEKNHKRHHRSSDRDSHSDSDAFSASAKVDVSPHNKTSKPVDVQSSSKDNSSNGQIPAKESHIVPKKIQGKSPTESEGERKRQLVTAVLPPPGVSTSAPPDSETSKPSHETRSRSRSKTRSHLTGSHKGSSRRSTSFSSSSSSSSWSRERSHDRSHSKSRSPSWSRSPKRYSHKRSVSRSRSRHHSSGSEHSSGDHRHRHHRDSRSPSIRRRRGSPSHLDKRRITSKLVKSLCHRSKYRSSRSSSYSRSTSRSWSSARKRPVPYYRPSPSPSGSDSEARGGRGRGPPSCSSYSPRRRSRSLSRSSFASRSRFRSLSRSPSLDNIMSIRRRKGGPQQQQQQQQQQQPKLLPLMQVQTQPHPNHHLTLHSHTHNHHHQHHHHSCHHPMELLSTSTKSQGSHSAAAACHRSHRTQPQGAPQPLMLLQPQPQLQSLSHPLLQQHQHTQQQQQQHRQVHQQQHQSQIPGSATLNPTLSRFHMQYPVGNLIS